MWTIILSVLTIFFLGAFFIAGRIGKIPRYERPSLYFSETIIAINNLSTIIAIGLLITLFIINWKLALILLIASSILNRFIQWIFESIVLLPIALKLDTAALKAGYNDEE